VRNAAVVSFPDALRGRSHEASVSIELRVHRL